MNVNFLFTCLSLKHSLFVQKGTAGNNNFRIQKLKWTSSLVYSDAEELTSTILQRVCNVNFPHGSIYCQQTDKLQVRMGASSLHCVNTQMADNMLPMPINIGGIDWPFSLHMQCVFSSQCLHREKEREYPLYCQNTLYFYWTGVKCCGKLSSSKTTYRIFTFEYCLLILYNN